jgi:hypothetical protein
VLVGEQQCPAGHDIQRPIVGITGIVAQPFTQPSAALVDDLGDIIEREAWLIWRMKRTMSSDSPTHLRQTAS